MIRIWAIARQTIAEGIRMKIALVFIGFIGLLLVGLPLSLRHEDSVSSAVQTFLSFSLGGLDFLLAVLTIFLARSLSEEVVSGQIMILMTKPIPRWQFVVGKWLGIVTLTTALVVASGAGIYGVARLIAAQPPRDEMDELRLRDEVLTARHAISMVPLDLAAAAEREYNERLETGAYTDVMNLNEREEKARLKQDMEQRWRTIFPLEGRVFEFEDVRCERSPDRTVQVRYKAEVFAYPIDEILRCVWFIGNPDKGTPLYQMRRRDVIGRYHSLFVPSDAVAEDRTLRVELRNVNPYENEPQFSNTISFNTTDDLQVFFGVGTFGGNLVRQLGMMTCKLVFLAAFALMMTCVFSFPVACLVSFSFLVMGTLRAFLTDAIFFFGDEDTVSTVFKTVVNFLYTIMFFLIPDFSRFNGTALLVNGRNVTLMWVLTAVRDLVLLGTTTVMVLACLLFQRREVAETSI